jgi:hypothetical protein
MRSLVYALGLSISLGTGIAGVNAQSPSEAAPAGSVPSTSTVPQVPSAPQKLELENCLANIEQLRREQAILRAGFQDEEQKKKIELLQKQVETLEKMVKLLADQLKTQPGGKPAVDKLEADVASLQARSVQAAHRDQELAGAVDDLREHIDAEERYGPRLPAGLKELFLPSGTQETPLSIYGTLCAGYQRIVGDAGTAANGAGRPPTPGGFYFGEASFQFLIGINDWAFISAEIGVGGDGSMAAGTYLNADFFVTDWLTIVVGRMVAPIGSFNDRLNMPFITKLPVDAPGSVPLLWQQVLPIFSLLGVEAKGACYLGGSPLKLEYAAYISNGLNLTPGTPGLPTLTELADLGGMTNNFSFVTNDKAVGGRLGLWWPEMGINSGISGMVNGDYVAGGFEDSMALVAFDFNYHEGNWDIRAEYGKTFQHTTEFLGANIRRQGVNAQIAYRPRDSLCEHLQRTEVVYRYGWVDFKGIDAAALDLTHFATPLAVPVRRQQNEVGINYWFSDRMVLKVAYQINDEPGFHLHDNQFISEFAWGW